MLSALVMRKKNVSIGRENNRILSYKNDSVIRNFLVVSTNFIKQVVEERNKKTPSVLTLGLVILFAYIIETKNGIANAYFILKP